MENKFTKKIYNEIQKAIDNLPKSAIERTKKEITRKGYDTTGYQYQFLVNVLNEVVGVSGWSFSYSLVRETEGKTARGRTTWEITVEMRIKILDAERVSAGGHTSFVYFDALKGAITNSLKKTLALFGVGTKAFEGTIDEDLRPMPKNGRSTMVSSKKISEKQIIFIKNLLKQKGKSLEALEKSIGCLLPETTAKNASIIIDKLNLTNQKNDKNNKAIQGEGQNRIQRKKSFLLPGGEKKEKTAKRGDFDNRNTK